MARHRDVEAFLASVRRGYELSGMDTETRRCVGDVFAALEASTGRRNEGGRVGMVFWLGRERAPENKIKGSLPPRLIEAGLPTVPRAIRIFRPSPQIRPG